MVDQTLLEILVCPETKQALHHADAALLEELNASVRAGSISNRGGTVVSAPVGEALVREDGRVLYPVRDDIPIMLIDESITLSPHA